VHDLDALLTQSLPIQRSHFVVYDIGNHHIPAIVSEADGELGGIAHAQLLLS
jgi:hypothetical protein